MNAPARSTRTVLTIGTFDGVHAGHRALIQAARDAARALGNARVLALVFDPNPAVVLRPSAVPARLSTFEQRKAWILQAGADQVERLEPTPELLALPGETFIRQNVATHNVGAFVEGPDFTYGHNRDGNVRTLAALGASLGFVVGVVEPVTVTLTDHLEAPARSTMVRWLLERGRVRDAACILGRPYTLTGTVVRGDQRGRTIGYPTANIQTTHALPLDGVYAGRARLPDGTSLAAAVSLGTKPTFGTSQRTLEAFLMRTDSPGAWSPLPGLSEYGWPIELELLAFVRDQLRFPGLPSLLEQMGRDCARIAEIVRAEPFSTSPIDQPVETAP